MQAGIVYTFFLTATDSGNAGIKASAAVTVAVQSSPVRVSILGGDRLMSNSSTASIQVGIFEIQVSLYVHAFMCPSH